MTDNEIIKALECCDNDKQCTECPMNDCYPFCDDVIGGIALDLINRQMAEIESYKKIAEHQQSISMDRHFEIERLKGSKSTSLTNAPEWISVDDRLPSMGERVIACIRSIAGEAYLSCYGVWIRNEHSFEDYMNGKVTHWMPIPAPPGTKKTDKRDDPDCVKCRDFMRCDPPMWPCERFDPIDEQEEKENGKPK